MGNLAIAAYGTLFKMGDGGTPETFTTIAEVEEIGGPSMEADTEDATTHDSVEAWEDVVVTILRSGEIELTLNMVPGHATHDNTTGLLSKFTSRAKGNYQMVFPDVGATTWQFSAFVTGFEPNAPAGGKLTATARLKITGKPTLV